jgi:hypothetical protein
MGKLGQVGAQTPFLRGGRRGDVLFVVEEALPGTFLESEEAQLLFKILKPMNLDPEQTEVLVLPTANSLMTMGSEFEKNLPTLQSLNPKVVIAMGPRVAEAILGLEPVRGQIQVRFGLKILVTEGLRQMLERPESKKLAWDELKTAIREVGTKESE